VANAATNSIVSAFRDVVLVIMLVTVMVTNSLKLTLVMLLLVPMIALLVTFISKRFRRISHRIQDSMGDVSHVTEEAVSGHRVVKVFQGQQAEISRFEKVNEKTRRLHMRMELTHLAGSSMVQVAAGLAIVLLMIFATRPEMLNDISAGTFTTIFWAMVEPFRHSSAIPVQSQLQKGLPPLTVFSGTDLEPEQDTGSYAVRVRGEIEFETSDSVTPAAISRYCRSQFHGCCGFRRRTGRTFR
jgi:subfamily B ATP-binding cassette protein MsbA